MLTRSATAVALALVASTAAAHHRQTPAIVPITSAGDATLPRLPPASRKAAAVTVDASIAVVQPFKTPSVPTFTFTSGVNESPAISFNGKTVVWDSDADPLSNGAPGQQILRSTKAGLEQMAVDPMGTSTNAAVDRLGLFVAFESTADLAATGNAGARQVFLRRSDGTIAQVSRGSGTSRNPSLGMKGRVVVFDSTTDPGTNADTGTAQVWIADFVGGGGTAPITSGAGPSESPILSDDERVVVFQSSADLAGDDHDTGVPQIFAYDRVSKTFAQVTTDVGGCTAPSALRIKRDWRIAYLCGGTAYFTMLRANQRFHLQTDGGDTTRLVPQPDAHFMLVATTADLQASGTTAGHQIYMVNLFKRPPEVVPSSVTWFPFQGIPSL